MKTALDICNRSEADFMYDYTRRINAKWVNIVNSKDITKNNKTFIYDFLQNCTIESLSNARIDFYIDKLNKIAIVLKKDFNKCDRKDIERLILVINNNYEKVESRRAYIVTIKKFYRWLTNNESPEIVSWIKTKNYSRTAKKQNEKDKVQNVLSTEEVELLINSAKTPRDRALIGVLYYSACRLGELIGLRIKDIEFSDYRTIINVNGKSGFRKIPIPECTTLLKNWIDYHPRKNDKESYLWINLIEGNRLANLKQFNEDEKYNMISKLKVENKHIGVRYIEMLINKINRTAGIQKKVNPHNFRHSRLTALGLMGLNTEMIKLYAGHSKNSNVTAQYTHYSSNDLANALDKLNGVKINEEKPITMIKCFRCNHMNRNTLQLCEVCGLVLSSEISMNLNKTQITQNKMSKIINSLLEDEVFRKAIALHLVNKGMSDVVEDLANAEK